MRYSPHSLLVLLLLAASLATLRASAWEEANAAYAEGKYAQAAPLYQAVIDQAGPTAARLFNLGNTYAKLNQPGPAVLCYERAALLAPRDADIQANLRLARPTGATALVSPPPLWQAPLFWFSLHEWSWLTTLGLVLLTVSISIQQRLFPYFFRSTFAAKRDWSAALPLLGLGLTLSLLGGLALSWRSEEKKLAILTASEPVLRLSPFPTADPVAAPPPPSGERMILGERHDNWTHLSHPNGTKGGWVPDQDVSLIIPAS